MNSGNMGIGYDGLKGDPGEKGLPGLPGKNCDGSIGEPLIGLKGAVTGEPGKPGLKGQKVWQFWKNKLYFNIIWNRISVFFYKLKGETGIGGERGYDGIPGMPVRDFFITIRAIFKRNHLKIILGNAWRYRNERWKRTARTSRAEGMNTSEIFLCLKV